MHRMFRIAAAILVLAIGVAGWIASGDWARRQALGDLHSEAMRTADQQARLLDSDLGKFRLLPIVLGEYNDLGRALAGIDSGAADTLNRKLASLSRQTGAQAIYIIDSRGNTMLASNAETDESFVGRNYRFRPYFIEAMREGATEYFAVGNVSGRPGLFLARRIGSAARPLGVVVVKVEFGALARAWSSDPGTSFIVDRRGIVLITTDPGEQFHTLRNLSPAETAGIGRSGQFLDLPLRPSRYRLESDGTARAPGGDRLLVATAPVSAAGWRLIHFTPSERAQREAVALARLAVSSATLLLAMLVAALFWRKTRAVRAAAYRAELEIAVASRTAALNDEIAERARSDRRFREAREELAQANRLASLGSITAGLVHEVNQPVATIRTLAENGQHHLAGARVDRVATTLASIVELTARIGSITQEMRRFARHGKGEVGAVSLDEVIAGTSLLIGDRFRAAGVTLDLPPPGQPHVLAGRVRLEQVLVNLLQNALEAVAGIGNPMVVLTIAADDRLVHLTVADNGPGIPPDLEEILFTPFVTGRAEGLGLGLGIARDIMMEFEGVLDLTQSPLGGAAFVATVKRA